jgi:hypothetical protein
MSWRRKRVFPVLPMAHLTCGLIVLTGQAVLLRPAVDKTSVLWLPCLRLAAVGPVQLSEPGPGILCRVELPVSGMHGWPGLGR